MRKCQRVRSSSEYKENQQLWSTDYNNQSSPRGYSSGKDSSSDSDVEAENAMKRSQKFSSPFIFGEDHQPQSKNQDREEEEELSPKNSNEVTEQVEAEFSAECVQLEKSNVFCDTHQPPRSSFFRPQELWLAMTRCISLRWPLCLSINRQSTSKLAYQVDHDQSEDTQSSISSKSTNESASSTPTSDDREVALVKNEEVRSRVVKSGPPPCRGVSRSSPRLPRARQVTDSVLASMILEKEMFLRIDLVDSGAERDDLRYWAEWKLSERTKELAEGVWLSRSQAK